MGNFVFNVINSLLVLAFICKFLLFFFLWRQVILSSKQACTLASSSQISCQLVLVMVCSTLLNGILAFWRFCLSQEEIFLSSLLNTMLTASFFSKMPPFRLRKFSSISSFLRVLTINWCWILSDAFFFITWDAHVVVYYSIKSVDYTDWNLNVKMTLHCWDKLFLVVVYHPFSVLLDSTC